MRAQPITTLGTALLTASALTVPGCGVSTGTPTQNVYTITEPVTSLKIDNPKR